MEKNQEPIHSIFLSKPTVLISLDFEMRWGVHDVYGINFKRGRHEIENAGHVVTSTLRMLAERNLRSTWATVGAIALNNWNEYFHYAPTQPQYQNKNLAVKHEYADLDPDGHLHFAPKIIEDIIKTPGQELGSHSFSHAHFRESGVTVEDFINDMKAVENVFKERFNITPVSLVFPRNQSAFLQSLKETSIKVWRGPEPMWFYDYTSDRSATYLPRSFRLIDSIFPLGIRSSVPEGNMLRASIFVRFRLPKFLWELQLRKIHYELEKLNNGKCLHLWWHPQDIGSNFSISKTRLMQVLDLVAEACSTGKILSSRMDDYIVQRIY